MTMKIFTFTSLIMTTFLLQGCLNSSTNFAWKSIITAPALESEHDSTLETHQDSAAVKAETDIPVNVAPTP